MFLTLLRGGASGTLAASEGGDTLAALGDVLVAGALAGAESADQAAAQGRVLVVGALAAAEQGQDSAAGQGRVRVAGSLAATDGADAFAAQGAVAYVGSLNATEGGSDALSALGRVFVRGSLAASEAADTASATGVLQWLITSAQARRLMQIHLLHGLQAGSPLTVGPSSRSAGAVAQTVTEVGTTITVATTEAPAAFAGNPGAMIDELAALHGLTVPLVVTPNGRAAGSITQTISTAGATTTVTRAT